MDQTLSLRPSSPPGAHRASCACLGQAAAVRAPSGRHIYAQVIDDAGRHDARRRLELDKELKGKTGATRQGAAAVGKTLAERAQEGWRVECRLRSRRLPVPWPGQGPRRRCPRRRTGV